MKVAQHWFIPIFCKPNYLIPTHQYGHEKCMLCAFSWSYNNVHEHENMKLHSMKNKNINSIWT